MLLAATSTASSGSSPVTLFLPILLFGVFYVFFLRPRSLKAKRAQLQAKEVSVGDRVLTTSGMFGRVTRVTDETVVLEVAPDVELSFVRRAISRRLDDDNPMESSIDAQATELSDQPTNTTTEDSDQPSASDDRKQPEDPDTPKPIVD